MEEGWVEKEKVALFHCQLNGMLSEVVHKNGISELEIAGRVLLGIRKELGRAGFDRHIIVNNGSLKGKELRHDLSVFRK